MFELCTAVDERWLALGSTARLWLKTDGTESSGITLEDINRMDILSHTTFARSLVYQNLTRIQDAIVLMCNSDTWLKTPGVADPWTLESMEAAIGTSLQEAPTRANEARFWQAQHDALNLLIYARVAKSYWTNYNNWQTVNLALGPVINGKNYVFAGDPGPNPPRTPPHPGHTVQAGWDQRLAMKSTYTVDDETGVVSWTSNTGRFYPYTIATHAITMGVRWAGSSWLWYTGGGHIAPHYGAHLTDGGRGLQIDFSDMDLDEALVITGQEHEFSVSSADLITPIIFSYGGITAPFPADGFSWIEDPGGFVSLTDRTMFDLTAAIPDECPFPTPGDYPYPAAAIRIRQTRIYVDLTGALTNPP